MPATATATLMNQISKGRKARPRRVMLYGTHGIGKSTFGAMAEKPIFVPTEDGLADIDCESFPLARSLGEVMAALESLYSGDHDYRTVVIDSLDWLERLIWAEVCADENVQNIEKIGYAKGFSFAIDKWRSVLGALDALRSDRGMTVVLIAHAKIEKFENPETVPYDRYSPRLHKLASALVQEWADEVLFATYKVHTVKVDEGFNKAKHNGVSTGERIIRTVERPPPTHLAKNRRRTVCRTLGLILLYWLLGALSIRTTNGLAPESTSPRCCCIAFCWASASSGTMAVTPRAVSPLRIRANPSRISSSCL